MLLQLPKWELFFSIFLLGSKPLTKSVQQKAKQASCSGTEKVYTSYPSVVVYLKENLSCSKGINF